MTVSTSPVGSNQHVSILMKYNPEVLQFSLIKIQYHTQTEFAFNIVYRCNTSVFLLTTYTCVNMGLKLDRSNWCNITQNNF